MHTIVAVVSKDVTGCGENVDPYNTACPFLPTALLSAALLATTMMTMVTVTVLVTWFRHTVPDR